MATGMDAKQLNEVMQRCKKIHSINYVSPVIDIGSGIVSAFNIQTYTDKRLKEFSIEDAPLDYYLFNAINEYLDQITA